VFPEDDANLRLANGFHLQVDLNEQRWMRVLPVARGWTRVLDSFASDYISEMDRWPLRYMVLLIDFDEDENRLATAKAAVPERFADRVFLLGVWKDPEALRADLGAPESVGAKLADDCRRDTYTIWEHPLLRHNANELGRLRERVRPILFPSD
jgi:hypothetical protein